MYDIICQSKSLYNLYIISVNYVEEGETDTIWCIYSYLTIVMFLPGGLLLS